MLQNGFHWFSTLFVIIYGVGSLCWVFWQSWQRRRDQRWQQDVLAKALADGALWGERVWVSTPEYAARKWSKWRVHEAAGVLLQLNDAWLVRARSPSGQLIERRYVGAQPAAQWLGGRGPLGSLAWMNLGQGSDQLLLAGAFVTDSSLGAYDPRRQHALTLEIWQRIAPAAPAPAQMASGFALEKNRRALALVWVFFGVMFYALFDYTLNPLQLLNGFDDVPRLPLLLGCPLLLWLAYRWLVAGKVPAGESAVLAFLLCAVLVAAYVPALKRIDAALGQARDYRYLHQGVGSFFAPARSDLAAVKEYRSISVGKDKMLRLAVDPAMPELDFRRACEFWGASVAQGGEQSFRLVHGPLGLWQLDLSPHEAAIERYYQSR